MNVVCVERGVRVSGWSQTVSTPVEMWMVEGVRRKRWHVIERGRKLSVAAGSNGDVEVLLSNGHIAGMAWIAGVLMEGPCL